MLRWFESFINPYKHEKIEQPPERLASFYWYFLRQAWGAFAVLIVMGFAAGGVELALFAFLGQLVDLAKASASPANFFYDHGMLLLSMAAVAAIVRPLLFGLHAAIINQVVVGNFTHLIRWQTHRYVLRQSLHYFQNDFAGRIANKIMQTGPALRGSVVQTVDALWFVVVYTTGAAVMFFQADPWLAVPLVIWLVIYIGALVYFVPRMKNQSTVMSEARSTLTGRIVDSYTNIMTVKLFAHTHGEDAYAKEALDDSTVEFHKMLRISTVYETTIMLVNGFLIVATCGLALWLWGQGSITLGAIAVAISLVIRINNMSGWIMWVMANIFESVGMVQEGMETISKPITVQDVHEAKHLRVPHGEVRYEGVVFHYGQKSGLMDNLNLTIHPGEKVGLIGRSGAGKSTLVNLLLRFHDLEGGRILIDGQDIAHMTQDSLRSQIGMVTQDTSLLHRAVRENISYGRPEATEAEVISAAKRAHAHEFIQGLVDLHGRRGYDAHVGASVWPSRGCC
jgi:ATP-binding cassette subfamily B multidrug efflux pump